MSPTSDDVRHQLGRLLASSVFANAGRMSRFLKFVVEQSLAGEGERLKEYVIGVEVFDRDTSYDPRLDSIVRVEAARLRSKLAEYYAGEGRNDSIVLSLPKGGYAPIAAFETRATALNGTNGATTNRVAPVPAAPPSGSETTDATPSARWPWALGALLVAGAAAALVAWVPSTAPAPELRIAVLPFSADAADPSGATLAQRLTEGVTAELVRSGRFSVVASAAARAEHATARRPRDVAAALDADVLIQARIRADGDRMRIETYAVSGGLEEKLWVESFAGPAADTDALQRDIAAAIVEATGALQLPLNR